MKQILLLISFLALSFAQTNNYFHDAKTLSMGGATVALAESNFPALTNPASLANMEKTTLTANIINPYSDFELFKIGSFTSSYKLENYGTIALSAEFFQVNYEDHILQSENSYILSHGFRVMEDVSTSLEFGYNIRMYQLIFNNFEGTGKTEDSFRTMIDLGFRATVYKRFFFGGFIKNIGNRKVGLDNSQELLREFQIGLAYEPYSGVITSFDLSKEIGFDNRYHFGLDYRVFQNKDIDLDIRFGAVSNPNQFSFGFGLRRETIRIHYGAMSHPIGLTHQFGIAYEF